MSANPTASTQAGDNRFGWLDFAKGLCIISVVWMWTDKYLELHYGWFHDYARFSLPFRMPDFFLISGLLLGRVINRPWRNYLDTRFLHYVYFLCVWSLIYVPISWIADRPATVGAGFRELIGAILDEPKGNLWFLQMLAVYFLFTRLTRAVPSLVMVVLAIWVYLHPLPTRIFAIELFGEHYVFFYTGYILAPRILQASEWMQKHRQTATLLLLIWAISNFYIMVVTDFRLGDNKMIALALRLLGVGGVITFSTLVWNWRPFRWLAYVGRNSLVVYLGFFIPLSFFVTMVVRHGVPMQNSWLAFAIWTGCVGLALLAHFVAMKFRFLHFLYERPAWARLQPSRRAVAPTVDATAG